MDELDRILDSLRGPLVDTLRAWVRVPSVKAGAEKCAPFGAELRRMLDQALDSCRQLGFAAADFDGYAGHADMGEGSDREALGILVHLDVVPAGDGWTRDPFGAVLEGGRLYGRGTSDNKGPAAAALYAMYAVKKAGFPLGRKVRLILGCDEESGWADIEHYRKAAVMPRSGFSPDASFPVINIEKGLCHLRLDAVPSADGLRILSMDAGERPNVVPGTATALVEGDADTVQKVARICGKYGWPVTAQAEGAQVRLTAQGIPGHAALPEKTRNAIGQLLITLRDLGARGPVRQLADAVGTEYSGEGLGISVEDGLSGKLTCNMGIIRAGRDGLYATLDIRYPLLADAERLIGMIKNRLNGFSVSVTDMKGPHYVPESSELVKSLLDAYHEVTGLEKRALAIGGGTYARALDEGVAFGATFPDEDEVAHQADEYISVESLFKTMKIIALAIVRLAAGQ